MRSPPTCLSFIFCGPLLLFGSWSAIIAIALQVNAGVSYLLDNVEDIYDDGGPLFSLFQSLTQTLCIYHNH